MTEGQIQSTIKELLQLQGWFVFKNHQSLGSYKGVADLYALRDGRHIWLEVKKPGGRQSPYQVQFEQTVKRHGGEYHVVTGIEDVKSLGLVDALL